MIVSVRPLSPSASSYRCAPCVLPLEAACSNGAGRTCCCPLSVSPLLCVHLVVGYLRRCESLSSGDARGARGVEAVDFYTAVDDCFDSECPLLYLLGTIRAVSYRARGRDHRSRRAIKR